jgi:hypothetical protein
MKALDPPLIPFTLCSRSTIPEMVKVLLLYIFKFCVYIFCDSSVHKSAIMCGGLFTFCRAGPRSKPKTNLVAG